jgi:hypothetical protein
VNALGDADQAVLIAASEPQQLQLLLDRCRIARIESFTVIPEKKTPDNRFRI